MSFAISSTSRTVVKSVARSSFFSSFCEPAQRVKCALTEYRLENFSREIPTRFQKEVMQPYVDAEAGVIRVDEINRLLVNIGHEQDCLSSKEKNDLLEAAGSRDGCLTIQQMKELLE